MKLRFLLVGIIPLSSLAIAADTPAPATTPNAIAPAANAAIPADAIKGPTGFLDIAWGKSPSEAKAAMDKRPDVTLIRESADELVYAGGTFADEPVEIWHLKFQDGNFYKAVVSFEYSVKFTDKGWAGDQMTQGLSALLNQKYGKNTGREQTGDHWTHTWKFADTPNSKDGIQISLYHSWQAGVVRLTYTDLYFEKLGSTLKTAANDL